MRYNWNKEQLLYWIRDNAFFNLSFSKTMLGLLVRHEIHVFNTALFAIQTWRKLTVHFWLFFLFHLFSQKLDTYLKYWCNGYQFIRIPDIKYSTNVSAGYSVIWCQYVLLIYFFCYIILNYSHYLKRLSLVMSFKTFI